MCRRARRIRRREPFGHRLSDRLGLKLEDRRVHPVPKGVQSRSAELDPLTESSQGIDQSAPDFRIFRAAIAY